MGEHAAQRITDQPGGGRKGSSTPTPQALGRQLLDILVYANRCRIGDKLTLDDLVETSDTSRPIRPPVLPSGRLVRDAMRSGICISLFQASQHVSMMAS